VLRIECTKLWRWYHDSLSGFLDPKIQESQYQHDIVIQRGSAKEIVRVPIFKAENFGKQMAIDEKQIGEEMHTIISNRQTGKIAVLARTVTALPLKTLLEKYPQVCRGVEIITRDMSATYTKVGNEVFENASQVADKFHIVRDLMESCQAVRVRYRQEILREQRLTRQKQKQQKEEPYTQTAEKELANGETPLEALARSRYLLFKYRHQWTYSQQNRAEALFEKYPEIEQAYNLACQFRVWIKAENVGKKMSQITNELNQWFIKVEESEVEEILNFKHTIERNLLSVLNYFRFGVTNAIAENINSRIQRFIMINQGTRHREFFYFRVANYFS
jgi:transposase